MTTWKSPISILRKQARETAIALKRAASGAPIAHDPAGKIDDARKRPNVKFMIAMDDKQLMFDLPWGQIREHSEQILTEFFLEKMREKPPAETTPASTEGTLH